MPSDRPPGHLALLRALVRRLPRGRYRWLGSMPHRGRFVAQLARDIGGARFMCDLSDLIAHEAYFTGIYEPPVTRVVQRHLADGAMFVDAGANWGYFTLLGASAVGTGGRVLALEPDPRMFEALEGNLRLNGFDQVTATAAAAASHEGRARLTGFDPHDLNRGVSRLGGDTGAGPVFDVACVTIDAVTADFPDVALVKIDVEGAEDLVLNGMQDGLASGRYRAIVLELHPDLLRARGIEPDACLARLTDAGYDGRTIDVSPATYRRALDSRVPTDALLRPLDCWRETPWPHLLWRKC
jgi:FkbM family methyltransferase